MIIHWPGAVPNLENAFQTAIFYSQANILGVERMLGNASTLFNSKATALLCCLHALKSDTPVLLPVTANLNTVMAVTQAARQPLLVDIDPSTLQMCPKELEESLKATGPCVVLLTCPGGVKLDERLLEAAKGCAVIVDEGILPVGKLREGVAFQIFDLVPAVASGAVVYTKFEKQSKALKDLRTSFFGGMSPMDAYICKYRLAPKPFKEYMKWVDGTCKAYEKNLPKKLKKAFDSRQSRYFPVKVGDVQKSMATLSLEGIICGQAIHSLLDLDFMSCHKEFPGVDSIKNKILALPLTVGIDALTVLKYLR